MVNQRPGDRKTLRIVLEQEQMELVEKLLAVLGQEEAGASQERIIEQALRNYTDEKVRCLSKRYNIDVRSRTLTELRQLRRDGGVDTAARDTIVLPVPENTINRRLILEERRWIVPGLDGEKLRGISYVGIYWRSPTWAVTHYAKIKQVDTGGEGMSISFEAPEVLGQPVSPRDPENRLRKPRYTTLSLLLEAKVLEELF